MAIKGDFESISLKNLKMVCNELNDSKLIEDDQKVNVKKNKKKLDLIEAFMEAVESIPEESEEEATLLKDHKKIVEMYNSLREIADEPEEPEPEPEAEEPEPEAEEPEPEPEAEEPEPEKKEKTKKKGKKADTKGEKADKKKEGKKKSGLPLAGMPKDDLGAVIGKGTNLINEEFKKGGTFEEIADKLGTRKGRVGTHYYSLVKCGVEFEVTYKKAKMVGGKEGKATDWVKIKKIPKDFKKV